MNVTFKLAAPLVAALAIAACSAGGSSSVPATGGTALSSQSAHMPQWEARHQATRACPMVVGKPTCLALNVTGISHLNSPSGLFPSDLETAYDLPSSTGGAGQLVAIVDAYDNPKIATDLAAYRTQFGLGTATFNKYNEHGQQSGYPQGSTGWGTEEDLDVDMVSAACPKCSIALIESDGSITGMEEAEATAVSLGAHIVSNSWICYGSTDCGDTAFSTYFDTPGVVYLAASGDEAYNNIGAPSVLDSVVAVGGSQLSKSGSKYNETVWNDAGSGCATGVTKPSWQKDPSCSSRTDADVSSEAGCSPGVAEYDTYGSGGWIVECGTSAASPLNAGVFALAGNASSQNAGQKFWTLKKKKRSKDLNYISVGSNGSCGGSYLCTAGTKQFGTYGAPIGWGSPHGVGAY
ncbi:MAG: peptidase S8 [Candidatus Eremiobacteraeota bacterium]|nr:peptidase S8 [Candidatus Eremiobacteraeota bacterium]